MIVYDIKDINIEGPWICYIYNSELDKYEPVDDIFMYSENKFYNKDGTGPWEQSDIEEISKICKEFNSGNQKIYLFKTYNYDIK